MIELLRILFFVIPIFLSLWSCEKDLIPVPDHQIYNSDSTYDPSQLIIDSITIRECPVGPPEFEYLDLGFCFGAGDCNYCINTFNEIITDVQSVNLPLTFVPSEMITLPLLGSADSSLFRFKAVDYDSGMTSCEASANDLIFFTCYMWELNYLEYHHSNQIFLNQGILSLIIYFRAK